MFEVICEIAVPNVNILRHFINPNGGVILDNGQMLDDGNASPVVGPYDRVFVILVDSHTLYCGQTLPLTLAEHCNLSRILYEHCLMHFADITIMQVKVKLMEKYYTQLIMPCDPFGTQTLEIWRTPMSVHRTYHTSQVSVVMSREEPVTRSLIISMFMKSNMLIFEQCSQWQKEREELLGTI